MSSRTRLLIGGAVLVALVIATAVHAQGPGPGGARGLGFGPGGPQAGRVLRGLNLTDAQKDQVRDITERHRQQMESEIYAILTPEQREQADKMKADREARLKQRRQRIGQHRPPVASVTTLSAYQDPITGRWIELE